VANHPGISPADPADLLAGIRGLALEEHRAKTGELAQLAAHQDQPGSPDPGLLAALPQLPLRLAGLPEHLRRSLYDAFQLQVRYHRPRHEVTIRVTIRADSLNHINGTVNAFKPQRAAEKKTETGSHVLSAPSRIRTCAHGSGGQFDISF
jgi:site-specific DNA recombinase